MVSRRMFLILSQVNWLYAPHFKNLRRILENLVVTKLLGDSLRCTYANLFGGARSDCTVVPNHYGGTRNPLYRSPKCFRWDEEPLYRSPKCFRWAEEPLYRSPKCFRWDEEPLYRSPKCFRWDEEPLYRSPRDSFKGLVEAGFWSCRKVHPVRG